METLRKRVEAEYEFEKENLMKFFVQNDFTFENSKSLAYSLRRAVFYIKRDVDKRRKWEKKTINHFRDVKKIEIEDLDILRSAKTHGRQVDLVFSKSAFGKSFLHRSHILFAIIFSEKIFYKKNYNIPRTPLLLVVHSKRLSPDPDFYIQPLTFRSLEPCLSFFGLLGVDRSLSSYAYID